MDPEAGFVWGKYPLEGDLVLTVVGEIHSYVSHWAYYPASRKTQMVRCRAAVGVACAWCDAGYAKRVRFVFPAVVDGELRVWEMGRVQHPMLKLLVAEGWLGRTLRVRRAYRAKNAEVQVFPISRVHVSVESVVDVEEFVAGLGGGQLALLPPPEKVPSSERSRSDPSGRRLVPRDA
jgi:hypothetical protein